MISSLRDQLIRDESWVNKVYPDPLTGGAPYTVGVGHTGPDVRFGETWTDAQIEAALQIDMKAATVAASLLVKTDDNIRFAAFCNMAFQMGCKGLRMFAHTLLDANQGKWQACHDDMLNSAWARQTPLRAKRLATQVLTGQWQ